MDFKQIDAAVARKGLLSHPFYQAWSSGKLTLEDLRFYAKQYYHLEKSFPRFLSRIHSSTEDAAVRQTVLENLVDEERGAENHRELWLRFAEGLGLSREEVLASEPHPQTSAAVESLMDLASDSDPAVGLAALYAYESQLPAVSQSKIDGLKAFYGVSDERAVRFFEVHKEMDAWHSEAERGALESLGASEETVRAAAVKGAEALWTFLDGVDAETRGKREPACACS